MGREEEQGCAVEDRDQVGMVFFSFGLFAPECGPESVQHRIIYHRLNELLIVHVPIKVILLVI